jgi:hypothetical protein
LKAIPVITAITFHEAAHGLVAYLLGDDTAWWLGRVSPTFNSDQKVAPLCVIAGTTQLRRDLTAAKFPDGQTSNKFCG